MSLLEDKNFVQKQKFLTALTSMQLIIINSGSCFTHLKFETTEYAGYASVMLYAKVNLLHSKLR